jgi:phosphoenolpyruvate-protein kinase (PTS system EI component)
MTTRSTFVGSPRLAVLPAARVEGSASTEALCEMTMPRRSNLVLHSSKRSSHAGIVSREMGIPAVVGTFKRSTRIRDGATIHVDGSAGDVTMLD